MEKFLRKRAMLERISSKVSVEISDGIFRRIVEGFAE